MTEEVSNKELEDWANEFCKDFDRICEKEDSRILVSQCSKRGIHY